MASEEALEHLLSGSDSWNKYVEKNDAPIDLKFAILEDEDLSNRNFHHCDFTGANLRKSNLDGSTFRDVNFEYSQLEYASFVNCKLADVHMRETSLSYLVMRDCILSGIQFKDLEATHVKIENCELNACSAINIRLDEGIFSDIRMKNSTSNDVEISNFDIINVHFTENSILQNWRFYDCTIRGLSIVDCEIRAMKVSKGVFENPEFFKCNIYELKILNSQVQNIDLSMSVVRGLDLSAINPATATLLNTALISCDWPRQTGKVTLLGKYIPSENLIKQPVQDIYNISPLLRREIGDAQYLTKLTDAADNHIKKILMRIWGGTTAFGQSIWRLSICSLLIISAHTLALLAVRGQLFGFGFPDFSLLMNEFGHAGMTFLGFSKSNLSPPNMFESMVLFSVRLFGFIVLGLWLTIASSRLHKLSSV